MLSNNNSIFGPHYNVIVLIGGYGRIDDCGLIESISLLSIQGFWYFFVSD